MCIRSQLGTPSSAVASTRSDRTARAMPSSTKGKIHRIAAITAIATMAALLAGLPLALGTGIGSELRRPLGISMVGGLLLSQVLTLYTTPVIYIFFDSLGQRFSRKRGNRGSGSGDEETGSDYSHSVEAM